MLVAPPPLTRCIDFANTRYWRGRETPTETFHALEDVLTWCEKSGELPKAMVGLARKERPVEAGNETRDFDDVMAFREALYRVLSDHAEGREPDAGALAAVRIRLQCAAPRTNLVRSNGGYWWALSPGSDRLADLLSPVLWSVADLLAGDKLASVKRCANEECRYLFLDDSKSGNRRWCSMASCGNRAKARRHYHLARKASEA